MAKGSGTATRRTPPTNGARPRVGRADVVTAAEEIVDRLGWDELTMTELAAALGVKAPSLYTHVRGLDDVRGELQVRTMRALGTHLRASATGRSGDVALRELAGALRAFARRWPHRYDGMTRAAIDRDALESAAEDASDVLAAVLRSFDVESTLDAQVATFAALHGVVALEMSGFFGSAVDIDQVYAFVLDGTVRAIVTPAGRPPARPRRSGGTR